MNRVADSLTSSVYKMWEEWRRYVNNGEQINPPNLYPVGYTNKIIALQRTRISQDCIYLYITVSTSLYHITAHLSLLVNFPLCNIPMLMLQYLFIHSLFYAFMKHKHRYQQN